MKFLSDTNIDFMKYRKFFVVVSAILITVGIFSVFIHGKLNVGVDFAGGTQMTLKFQDQPEPDELRQLLAAGGFDEAQIQRFGAEEDNEVLIRTAIVEGSEEGAGDAVLALLDERYNPDAGGRLDINRAGSNAISALLAGEDPDAEAEAAEGDELAGPADDYRTAPTAEAAEAILDLRREQGLVTDWDAVAALDNVLPEEAELLRERAYVGSFSVLGVENVGPQIGKELRVRGQLAVIFSLLGMMAYIWLRFELRFGVGAVVASLHDVLITLGLFALAGHEFNLTTIAGLLTLVGYSVNDTVVIFDRVRENMRKSRRMPMVEVMNLSLNQTLSRTVLTSGTTLLAVLCLYVLGGDVIRGFAFVLLVGVVVGTYSSVFVACPFTLLWEQLMGKSQREARRKAQLEKAS